MGKKTARRKFSPLAPQDACLRAATSAGWSGITGSGRAVALRAVAGALDIAREEIIRQATAETALTPQELAPEFLRMTGTLRMFADVVEKDAWMRPAINKPARAPRQAVGPNHDIRGVLMPLGAVAVFGASNFPLAYGVCGGDTASAWAAGCPVAMKEHPAHPLTGRLLATIARDALASAGVDRDALTYAGHEDPDDLSVAVKMLEHPFIMGVGFTGSRGAGEAIEKITRLRGIPLFAEMGSVNPVWITARALTQRGGEIGRLLAESVLLRHGQQCTKPGVILLPRSGEKAAKLIEAMTAPFSQAPARDMLAPWIAEKYRSRIRSVAESPGVKILARGASATGPRGAQAALLSVHISQMTDTMWEETFGPTTLIVESDSWVDHRVHFHRALTHTLFFEPGDIGDRRGEYNPIDLRTSVHAMACAAGRVVFNGVPTGVRVCEAMVHGGPWPATNAAHTTAVGPRAIERWCRPVCYQNAPAELLPAVLR